MSESRTSFVAPKLNLEDIKRWVRERYAPAIDVVRRAALDDPAIAEGVVTIAANAWIAGYAEAFDSACMGLWDKSETDSAGSPRE